MKMHQQRTTSEEKPLAPAVTPRLLIQTTSVSQTKPSRRSSFQVADNLLASFKYAWAGLSYALYTQRNFRVHLLIATLAVSLGLGLHLSSIEMAIIVLTTSIVLTMELLNTALEAVVDLTVQQTYHELAKIAKDCAAGAVLISAFGAVLIAGFLLLPPLWALF